MNPVIRFLSSVTRWLLMVVIGCAVLETAQPMNAAPEPAERSADTLIFPAGSKTGPAEPASTAGGGTWLFAAVICLAAAGFVYWKKRHATLPVRTGKAGLVVEETKSLGNRQFLVVAACGGRRFLLGVAPGSIRLLAPLDDKETVHARPAE